MPGDRRYDGRTSIAVVAGGGGGLTIHHAITHTPALYNIKDAKKINQICEHHRSTQCWCGEGAGGVMGGCVAASGWRGAAGWGVL